jgi:hypothetical protein
MRVCFAFPAGPSSATGSSDEGTIVNSMQATDRPPRRVIVLGRARQTYDEWCKALSRFPGDDPPGPTRQRVHLVFAAAAPS